MGFRSKKGAGITPVDPLDKKNVPNSMDRSIKTSLYRQSHPLNPKQMAFLRHRMNETSSSSSLPTKIAAVPAPPSANIGADNRPFLSTPAMAAENKFNALKKFLKRAV